MPYLSGKADLPIPQLKWTLSELLIFGSRMKTAKEAFPNAHRISVPMSSAIHSRPMTVKSEAQPISLVPFLDVTLLELLNMDRFWTMS